MQGEVPKTGMHDEARSGTVVAARAGSLRAAPACMGLRKGAEKEQYAPPETDGRRPERPMRSRAVPRTTCSQLKAADAPLPTPHRITPHRGKEVAGRARARRGDRERARAVDRLPTGCRPGPREASTSASRSTAPQGRGRS